MSEKIASFEPKTPLNWSWITMEGPDAQDFLHRLSTVNLKTLREGSGAQGFFLDPQGRIKAQFYLWRTGPQAYAFELDGGADGQWSKRLLDQIEKFTFAEKFTLTAQADWKPVWVLGGDLELSPQTTCEKEGIRFCHHGNTQYGKAWVSVWGPNSEAWLGNQSATKTSFENLEHARILALHPAVDRELTESANPLELGCLISENKGCYPGQEVIEKIISLGAPAKRLCLVSGTGAVPSEATSSFVENGQFQGLALLRKNDAKAGAEVKLPSGSSVKVEKVSTYQGA